MRKIRFRAKSIKDSNRWEWVYGWFTSDFTTQPLSTHLILTDKGVIYNVDPLTLGQYTGLRDKNDKCVFEGDLVKSKYYDLSEVVWHDKYATFCLRTVDDVVKDEYTYSLDEIEVIGNIYENPNLLKEENNE